MHPKLLYFRHKLFRYRAIEQQVAAKCSNILDIGCGDGENLLRFRKQGLEKHGIEISFSRLRKAHRARLNVEQASGTYLPYRDNQFDMIYIAHVLHHVGAYEKVLAEIKRVGSAETRVFIIETVTDHPILRLARQLHPVWQGDEVEADWNYEELCTILSRAGFTIQQTGRYNVLFFLWEMLPLALWPLELFTPLFVYLDLLFAPLLKKWSAHCYFELTISESDSLLA